MHKNDVSRAPLGARGGGSRRERVIRLAPAGRKGAA